MPIYIVTIAWMFVVVLMAAAEAIDSSVIGALMTLLFYGLLPLSIVLYLISTPARRKSRARREAAARELIDPLAPPATAKTTANKSDIEIGTPADADAARGVTAAIEASGGPISKP